MSLVTLDQVHKYYGDFHVLKGIDLNIKAGEVVSIIGKSGSGKSTLLRCINGLEEYQQGGISVDDKEVTSEDIQVRRLALSVGMIFQNFNLFPHLTVGENIMLAPTIVLKKSKAEAEKVARAMLEKVGLGDKFDRYPEKLSGGQQQRVAIARAFITSPNILFADAPTGNLDAKHSDKIESLLFEMNKEKGTTLVLVTHDNTLAEHCDRQLTMNAGELVETTKTQAQETKEAV